jgi:hypothetical protein
MDLLSPCVYAASMASASGPQITDWIQAWGSVLSLIVAAIALLFTGLLLRHEIHVRRAELADTIAAQARLVVPQLYAESAVPQVATRSIRWSVRNYSSAPVTNLRIEIGWQDRVELMVDRHVVLEPNAQIEEELGLTQPIVRRVADPKPAARRLYISVEFTDAAGLLWVRDGTQPPRRITDWSLRSHSGIREDRPFIGPPMTAQQRGP